MARECALPAITCGIACLFRNRLLEFTGVGKPATPLTPAGTLGVFRLVHRTKPKLSPGLPARHWLGFFIAAATPVVSAGARLLGAERSKRLSSALGAVNPGRSP